MRNLGTTLSNYNPAVSGHMAQGRSQTLPNEIIDRVIDQLFEEYKALAICGQVCRAWVKTCRFHLFYCLRINENRGSVNLAKLAEVFSPTTPSQSIGQYVKIFRFIGGPSYNIHEAIKMVLPCMPHLTHLNFDDVGFCGEYAVILSLVPATIKTLEIMYCDFASPVDVAELLSRTSGLRELRWITKSEYELLEEPISSSFSIAPEIVALDITLAQNKTSNFLLRWLGKHPTIRILNLTYDKDTTWFHQNFEVALISDFLRALGGTLEHLVFSDCQYNKKEEFPTLDASFNLKIIEFNRHVVQEGAEETILLALEQLVCRRKAVPTIVIHVLIKDYEPIDWLLAFKAMATRIQLTAPLWENTTLRIIVSAEEVLEDARKAFEQNFKEFHLGGRLHCTYQPPWEC